MQVPQQKAWLVQQNLEGHQTPRLQKQSQGKLQDPMQGLVNAEPMHGPRGGLPHGVLLPMRIGQRCENR